jgi:hypothetical protein
MFLVHLINSLDRWIFFLHDLPTNAFNRIPPFHLSKAVYMTGTKKQKMNMSNAIVESIYSMQPPGRFLKQCPDTGQWNELSKREAADRVAQAMAYAMRGKDKLKQQREQRRRSRSSSRQKSEDDVVEKSSQRAYQPTNNHSEGVRSSSVARHNGLAARGSGAAGPNNAEFAVNDDRATDLVADGMLLSDNSNLQQQLLQQLLQSSTTTTLPTSSGAPLNANQNGLVQVLAQALQQQQQRQQQQLQQQLLPLQYALGQDSLGLQTQTPSQPALLEGLTQLLSQTQQQQQQNEQQQLLLQRLLNQQTVLPSASLPPTLSLSAPFLTGPRSQPANGNLLQNQVHLQTNSSNAPLLNVLSNLLHQPNSANNLGSSNAPQGAQQMDQLQRQQLLASSLGASSNTRLPFQQQQSQPFDTLLQQAALQLQQNSHVNSNSQGLPPTAINFAALASANATAQLPRQEGSED